MNKRKIINDPVYGFVTIPNELLFDIIEHPYFQRLRRIQQLGLTNFVYPGALHTRFSHTLGAMHLMGQALESLRSKGHEITEDEGIAVTIAILLHDIGHGPYSHALEHALVPGVSHEDISLILMQHFNQTFDGRLEQTIEIFTNEYPKHFLHQLVSSQLDMDRLDYLSRDSFFTGVAEGVISYDRIIKMLDVVNDELVVEAKGIYSIEKFIIARRLMYWQVYLHKTVIAAEQLLLQILKRAKVAAGEGIKLFATRSLKLFIDNDLTIADFEDQAICDHFCALDDYDIFAAVKEWQHSIDPLLARMCQALVARHLPRVELQEAPFPQTRIDELRHQAMDKYGFSEAEAAYLVFTNTTQNHAYDPQGTLINILQKNGQVTDIAEASDQLNISQLKAPVVKHYLCYPKELNSLEC